MLSPKKQQRATTYPFLLSLSFFYAQVALPRCGGWGEDRGELPLHRHPRLEPCHRCPPNGQQHCHCRRLLRYILYSVHSTNVLYSNSVHSTLCVFLLQKYWSMLKVVGSNPATGSYSSTFILSIQIRNFPTPLPYHMYVQLPHLGKKCCTT